MRWDAAALTPGLPLGPPALEALLSRMLAVDPADRPEGPGEVAAELRGIQVELGRPLTPPTPHVRRRPEEVLAPRFPPGRHPRAARRRP